MSEMKREVKVAGRGRKPSWSDWQTAAGGLGLKLQGGELVGPCPVCGGEDRFHVRRTDGGALVGCRSCIDGKADGRKAFGAVLRAAFPNRKGVPEIMPAKPPAAQGAKKSTKDADAKAIAGANALWLHSKPAMATPAMDYLLHRGVAYWSLDERDDPCRWFPSATANPKSPCRWSPTWGRKGGALLWPYNGKDGFVRAVDMEALTAAGRWPPVRFRQTRGRKAGTWCRQGTLFGGDGPLHIAEGPLDALAIAATEHVECWAAGGAAALSRRASELASLGRAIVIRPDGDSPGRLAAAQLRGELAALGVDVRVEWLAEGDPASALLNARRRDERHS